MLENEVVKFIKKHQELTPEQIKKLLRETYPKADIRNEDVERLLSRAWAEMRGKTERGRER